MINTDARQTIKTLGLFVLWIALMTLAGWYGRGQGPGPQDRYDFLTGDDRARNTGR
jgi:hypothetical protein